MAKISFIARNVIPLSQNNRTSALVTALGNQLIAAHNLKYPLSQWLRRSGTYELGELEAKVFYLHKVPDRKDADNISKPLWDSLNEVYYKDDQQIKYLETLKVSTNPSTNWLQFDLSEVDNSDYAVILDFLLNKSNQDNQLLFVSIEEYKSKNIKF